MTSPLAVMTGEFLDKILPTVKDGVLFVAVGSSPHLDTNGRYGHGDWHEHPFPWPDARGAAIAHIQDHAHRSDVYVCPYLMKTTERRKGNAAYRALLHCDVDTPVDTSLVTAIGADAFTVWSGTSGHGHVYVPLSCPVTAEQHANLERWLVNHLGGDTAKISENDLLRPPGTFNHKPTVAGGIMTPVWST